MTKTGDKWSRGLLGLITLSALFLCILLFAADVLLGNLNQDEGWYLYAAKKVSQGFLPYRDFAYTQGPVLPVVYSFLYAIVRQYGVLGGRLITAGMGLVTCLLTAWLTGRLLKKEWRFVGAVAAFMLIGINVYQAYFTSIVKTYSLCTLFLMGGLLALSFAQERRWRVWVFGMLSGFLMAGAAGTRLSAGAAMAVTGFYLLYRFRLKNGFRWMAYGVGGLLGLMLVFGTFAWVGMDGMKFGLLDYHTLRSPGSLAQSLVFKAGFVSRFVQGYYLIVLLCVVSFMLRFFRKPEKEVDSGSLDTGLFWLAGLAMTLVHLVAPFPYDDYQVVVMPIITVAVVVSLVRYLATCIDYSTGKASALLTMVLLAATASAFSSPVNQEWMVIRRDRIWWKMKNKPDIIKLQDVARVLKQLSEPRDTLLTQDAYLAVETDMDVPHGLEMGPFSYYPDFDDIRIKEVGGVLNKRAMLALLDAAAPEWAAMSGYGLSIRSPDVTELTEKEQLLLQGALHRRYQLISTVQDFGQGHTRLRIYKRKKTQ